MASFLTSGIPTDQIGRAWITRSESPHKGLVTELSQLPGPAALSPPEWLAYKGNLVEVTLHFSPTGVIVTTGKPMRGAGFIPNLWTPLFETPAPVVSVLTWLVPIPLNAGSLRGHLDKVYAATSRSQLPPLGLICVHDCYPA